MAEITLLHGEIALVDNEDAERVRQYRWRMRREDGYVKARGPCRHLWLHRFVMGLPNGNPLDVDHRDGNRLDNRKHNLRPATRSQNGANRKPNSGRKTSRFKGVSWYKRDGKWAADIQWRTAGIKGGKRLGYFETEIEAAEAYNKAAQKQWGEFALLNEI
jgi:hypothetical protein